MAKTPLPSPVKLRLFALNLQKDSVVGIEQSGTKNQFDVLTSTSWSAAIDLNKTQRVAVLVIDVLAKDSSDVNAILAWRSQSEFHMTPILAFVPAGFPPEKTLELYGAGATDVLEKPLGLEVLKSKLKFYFHFLESSIEKASQTQTDFAILDQVFSESPSFMTTVSVPEFRYLHSNEEHRKLIRRSDIIGKTIYEVEPDMVSQGFVEILNTVIATGQPYIGKEMEVRYDALKDHRAETKYLDFTFQPLRNSQGEIYAITSQGHDVTEKVQSRKSIENERANFRNLFKQTPEIVCITRGPHHRFEFVNEAHIKLLGFDATGMSVGEAQPESKEIHGILDQVYQTGVTASMNELSVTVGENVKNFSLTYAARYDDSGTIDGIMILGTDVSERKQAQIEFEKNVDGSPAILWITEKDGSCSYLSKQWYEFTGQTPGEALGFGWLDATHPDDKQRTADIYMKANSEQKPFYAEYRLKTKSGQYRWAIDAGNPRFDSEGNYVGYAGTVFDIHERITTDHRLKDLQARFQKSAEATNLGVWYCDLPFDELIWNKEVKHHFFLPPEARVTIETFYERIHPDDRAKTRASIESSIRTRIPYDTVYRTWDPNDAKNIKFIRAVGWTDYSVDGTPIRFDGITLDVTEEKHREEELKTAKDEAVRANQLKSAFLANMSHEIRTPLGAMLGFADLLRDEDISKTDQSNYIDILVRNGEQLSVIINDILDLSKVEAGHLSLEFTDTPPNQIAEEVVSLLQVKANEKGLTLDLEATNTTPLNLVADPTRVRQVLLNLIGNAIKFTPSGSVTVKSYGTQGPDGRATACFEIKDTGIGLDESQKDRIFDVFVQADGSMTRRFGGTGLGLALSRRLARALGGDVTIVESEPGRGSTFLFCFSDHPEKRLVEAPLTERQKQAQKEDQTQYGPDALKDLRVLVVDDAPENQELITRFLERHGARIDAVENGLLGYRRALQGEYDVVLMDIQMPEMDGYTATQKLRAAGYTKPIIALTAHAMSDVRKKCLNVGCTDHMSKPINPRTLVSKIVHYTSQIPKKIDSPS